MILFNPNELIKSADVNANFAGLADGSEINDSAITYSKIDYSTLPIGQLTSSTTGSSGGNVIGITTETELELDTFNGTDTAVITKHSNGKILVNVAGWYHIVFNIHMTDGSNSNTTIRIDVSEDNGSNFYGARDWTEELNLGIGRGLGCDCYIYLEAGALIRGKVYTYTNAIRLAPRDTNELYAPSNSLTVRKVA